MRLPWVSVRQIFSGRKCNNSAIMLLSGCVLLGDFSFEMQSRQFMNNPAIEAKRIHKDTWAISSKQVVEGSSPSWETTL